MHRGNLEMNDLSQYDDDIRLAIIADGQAADHAESMRNEDVVQLEHQLGRLKEKLLEHGIEVELWAECQGCGKGSEIVCEPSDFDKGTHYCGGSDRCCP